MRALFQLTDKEIEDMTHDELRIERMIHVWAANRWETAIFNRNRHIKWLDDNRPDIDLEDLKGKYKRGEIPQIVYAQKSASQRYTERDRKSAEMQILYAKEMKAHERAIVEIIKERIEELKRDENRRKTGPKKIDPRKPSGRNNPKSDWREKHQTFKRQKPLKSHARFWSEIREKNTSANVAMQKSAPIVTWDYDKLKKAARVAGYYTDEMIVVTISRELELSIAMTHKLLKSGKMTWGQAMLIGALFEMTPALFCDVFLNGYFKEIADGRFVAQIDDKEPLRTLK